jgi:hypothetical protein
MANRNLILSATQEIPSSDLCHQQFSGTDLLFRALASVKTVRKRCWKEPSAGCLPFSNEPVRIRWVPQMGSSDGFLRWVPGFQIPQKL